MCAVVLKEKSVNSKKKKESRGIARNVANAHSEMKCRAEGQTEQKQSRMIEESDAELTC